MALDLGDSNKVADQARQDGQGAVNGFNPTAVANDTRSGYSDLFGKQAGGIDNYVGGFAKQIATQPQATDLYNTANEKFNVPTLASNANYLQNQVTNQLPQVQSQARGFDVSQGQVDNQVNQNLRYLEPQATAATNNLNTAEGLAGQYVQAGQAQNTMNLLPYQQQGTMLNDLYARQATGFGQAQQQELDGLISKMQSGVQLSQMEMDRANALSQAESAYQSTVDSANIGADASKYNSTMATKYQTLKPADTLVNTFTGASQRAK